MEETKENGEVSKQVVENATEQCVTNNMDAEETDENGLHEKLVFKHNDSVKLKSYQKLHKKQHGRRSHKKVNHIFEGDSEKQKECGENVEEFGEHGQDPNSNETCEDSIASSHTKRVHYGGETRVRSLSGVEEEHSDDGCDTEVS